MEIKKLVVNKSALKRIFYIYLPCAVAVYLVLTAAAFMTDRSSPPLDLSHDFADRLPIIYDDNYNIGFFGLEKLHKFDTAKYRKIHDALVAKGAVAPGSFIPAAMPDDDLLRLAHSPDYLDSLNSSFTIAKIIEVNAVKFLPAHLSRNLVLVPMLYQTGGSLLAARAALRRGWAVNLGGGFHHASRARGEGFCAYADISLIIRELRRAGRAQKIMVIDLDAHQGNGHETDFGADPDVFILDMYNREVFPHDEAAKQGIDIGVALDAYTQDPEYLAGVDRSLTAAFARFTPDLVIYNAGTDLLQDDPLGALEVSARGVLRRDEKVFRAAFDRKIPIVMLLSGGYQQNNAAVITDSLLNLNDKFKLFQQPPPR